MTKEEAIEIIEGRNFSCIECIDRSEECCKALDMAIEALQENEKLIKEVERWKSYYEDSIANEW